MERTWWNINLHKRKILSMLLILAFLWSLSTIHWSQELIHGKGIQTAKQIAAAFFRPDLSADILMLALESTWTTLSYAVAGMSLAIIIAFFFGILASGILFTNIKTKRYIKSFFRGQLGFMRAIHELVWAWLFVASIGLSPFAAIFALAIPYGGILGKIFADMLEDVRDEPIKALEAAGATRVQALWYGYLPMVRSNIVSYAFYRFECAVRSSAIMSFVGIGGLGYQIQLSLDDLQYNEVWTFVFFLILLVILIDAWSNHLRKNLNSPNIVKRNLKMSFYSIVFLSLLSWFSIFTIEKASLTSLFSEQNLSYAKQFFNGLLGIGEEDPAFLNSKSWGDAFSLTIDTLLMSVMATGFATIAALLTVVPAARNIADGSITSSKKWHGLLAFGIVRGGYIFTRAVPELVWAMIIIFIFKPGILPGAIALAIHNYGILGKLLAEVIEDLDSRPVRNLASSGASRLQLLFYGVLPTALPRFLTYILYRWEVIMRTTIVVGFVGAGGLGQQFKLSMSFFHYTDIALLLFFYLVLVFSADFISERARSFIK
ncbi:PhnE/PtxC family ABC transporter permease [Mesobacillus jeotgali]|uniref:PhnE/PtxC family ABC transporter permease n=1 Tax=Mesobacillus jeotgali TaxID=129985 RepID=UPI0009A710E6|nr:ABC transporter permease subunit [Mesobacillus jeotgali]